jgi:hypothetical protein
MLNIINLITINSNLDNNLITLIMVNNFNKNKNQKILEVVYNQ